MRQNRPIPYWIRMRTDNTISLREFLTLSKGDEVFFQMLETSLLEGTFTCLTRRISTNLCMFLLYQLNIFCFTFAFVNYTVIYKTKVERKDIELVDEEEAQIDDYTSSPTEGCTPSPSEDYMSSP
ncbi:hypothetical protein JHK86_043050 [Glycine max]|nr:hypothetical protein JHK86_043050 [Glycine max]